MCSPYNAPVLLGAGLADHGLQVVELGEPRSLQTDQIKMQAGRMLRERVECEVAGVGDLLVVSVPRTSASVAA